MVSFDFAFWNVVFVCLKDCIGQDVVCCVDIVWCVAF